LTLLSEKGFGNRQLQEVGNVNNEIGYGTGRELSERVD